MTPPILNPRIERKLGRKVLAAIADMGATSRDNLDRFHIVKHQLERAVADYTKYTHRDTLLHPVDYYGYR